MNNEEEFEWPPPPPLGPRHQSSVTLSLPAFWSANDSGWFAHVESRFRTRRIFDEWVRFNLIVAALDSDTILVTSPPEDEPYTALKEGLLHNHQLTDYQRIEKQRWIAATATGAVKLSKAAFSGRGGNNSSRGRGGSRPAKGGALHTTAATAAEASTSPAALSKESARLCNYH